MNHKSLVPENRLSPLKPHEHAETRRLEVPWSSSSDDVTESIASPIFMVGSVRSGTTLLRLMLDHHPEIAFLQEFPYAVEKLSDEGWPDHGEYHEFLKMDRVFLDGRLVIDHQLDYPQLMNSFLKQKRDRDDKIQVGATVHIHFDRLSRIWPEARYIHIVRDGRDVARSRIDLGWAGNMYTGVDSWIEAELLWNRVRPEIPAARRIEVKYEELILNPERELTRICEFLEVPYDSAMLRYNEDSTYSPPDLKLIGQWKRKVSPSGVRLAESRIAEKLVERGYELSGHEPLSVGPLLDFLLRLDDRRNRLAARYRTYGPSTFAAEFVVRALEPVYRRLSRFRRSVRERINEIETAGLK